MTLWDRLGVRETPRRQYRWLTTRSYREMWCAKAGLDLAQMEKEYPPEHALPSMAEQGLNYANALLSHAKAGLRDAPEDVQAARLAVCRGQGAAPRCDSYRPSDGKCAHCGCTLVGAKVKWAEQSCPLGKWGPHVAPE